MLEILPHHLHPWMQFTLQGQLLISHLFHPYLDINRRGTDIRMPYVRHALNLNPLFQRDGSRKGHFHGLGDPGRTCSIIASRGFRGGPYGGINHPTKKACRGDTLKHYWT